jgi:hypothetical protein
VRANTSSAAHAQFIKKNELHSANDSHANRLEKPHIIGFS